MTDTALIKTYGVMTRMLGPFASGWIKKRTDAGKEDPDRVGERHGEASLPRPEGRLIWMHGASVGETLMLLPVINRLLDHDPEASVLVTAGTTTAADILSDRLPERAFHQYVPLDYPKAVNGFLDHWKPDMAVWAESDIWPNMIRLTKKRGIPMALLNARMSAKSVDGWAKRPKTAEALFGAFDLILAADDPTARGLSGLLNRKIEAAGNLKDAASPLPVDGELLEFYKPGVSRRKIWCAASTHDGEDEIIIAAHQQVLARFPQTCLILAPRHPERTRDIQKLLKQAGLNYVVRSEETPVTRDTQVLLFDTIGEMGLAYRLSHISFVCGSLVEGLAGHNPLEPARLDNAVLTGKHIASFADTFMHMIAFNAAKRLLTTEEIAPTLIDLFENKEALANLRDNARAYADSRDSVLDYVWNHLSPLLPEVSA